MVTAGGHGVATLLGAGVADDGGMRPDGEGCNTNSPSPSSPATVTMVGCPLMPLTHDTSTAATELAAGVLSCPSQGCSGRLGPWGHALSAGPPSRLGPERGPHAPTVAVRRVVAPR